MRLRGPGRARKTTGRSPPPSGTPDSTRASEWPPSSRTRVKVRTSAWRARLFQGKARPRREQGAPRSLEVLDSDLGHRGRGAGLHLVDHGDPERPLLLANVHLRIAVAPAPELRFQTLAARLLGILAQGALAQDLLDFLLERAGEAAPWISREVIGPAVTANTRATWAEDGS